MEVQGSGEQALLADRSLGGPPPAYFENLNGLMQVTFPQFAGQTVSTSPDINRRDELAKLILQGDRPQFARAFVNRMWSHFHGVGLVNPVDDLGPAMAHESSHRGLLTQPILDQLTDDFVASHYDCRQLVRWICRCDAYQLPNEPAPEPPYIAAASRLLGPYPKKLTPEQQFDSWVVATEGVSALETASRGSLDLGS